MKELDLKAFTEQFAGRGDVPLIDVLDEEMFRNEHLPGAINIPLQSIDFIEQVRLAVPDKSSPVIVYSADSECLAWPTAARQLEDDGYEQVFAYTEGIEGWKEAGRELESDIPTMTPKEEAAQNGGELR